MIIEKIHIDTFGKLADFDLELSPGMNIIEGDNESGKSTIAAFIKFILYGVPSKKRAEMLSWRTGGAAGSLTVFSEGKRYRIERAVVGSREAVQLIDGDNNMPIRKALDGTTPGELFLGVGADMFSATAFVSQLGGAAAGGSHVAEGIENILFSADESVNTQRALAKLDAARAALLHKNEKGGKLYDIGEQCAELEVRLARALAVHDDILNKEAQLDDVTTKLDEANAKSEELHRRISKFEASALLELFDRKRVIEAKVASMRPKLEADNATRSDEVARLENYNSRIAMLRLEVEETEAKLDAQPMADPTPELDDYISLGGREGLTAKSEGYRTKSKAYVAVGVVMLVLGLLLAAFGLRPMINGGEPTVIIAAAGGVLAAFGVTMFILSASAKRSRLNIEFDYDLDALDRAIEARDKQLEAVKFAHLAAVDARRRYDEACAEVREICGCEAEELEARIAEANGKLHSAGALKAEYDKHMSLLSQIRTQLGQYSEEELRRRAGEDVDTSGIDPSALPDMRREADFAAKMAVSLEKHKSELEKTLAGLYPTAEKPAELTDKLAKLKSQRTELTKKHAAYKLAYEKLCEAGDELRRSVSPRLAADSAQLMAYITDGKYRELGVGSTLEMSAETEGGMKPIGILSAGTQDAAYLSLRMALISLLYRKSRPPMIYDESFVKQDNTRLANLLKLVSMQEGQSLVFTTNGRESAAMSTIGEFEHIHL